MASQVDAPDLWANLSNIKDSFSFDADKVTSNDPISVKEASKAKAKLEVLRRRIKEQYANTNDIRKIVDDRFDYLEECLERQRKMDWIHTLVGVLASLAISVGVSATNSDTFWRLVKESLGNPLGILLGQ